MIVNLKSMLMLGFVTTALTGFASVANAQSSVNAPVNTTVQLPVLSFFNVQTVVSVPDAGIRSLGGVSRHASGRTSRGVPGWGRGFSNRSRGFATVSSNAAVRVRIISLNEMSEDVLSNANRRASIYESKDPNGSNAVQARADFISRNVGRSKR